MAKTELKSLKSIKDDRRRDLCCWLYWRVAVEMTKDERSVFLDRLGMTGTEWGRMVSKGVIDYTRLFEVCKAMGLEALPLSEIEGFEDKMKTFGS